MPTVDVGIVTGLLEEFKVLKRLLPPMEEVNEGAYVWFRTRIVGLHGVSYEIVATFQDDMGPLAAQARAIELIDRWDPAYIVLVGIAGSFASDVALGDVLVSQQIFYYDPGKVTSDGIRYRPQGYPSSVLLIRQLEALLLDETAFTDWQQAAQTRAAELAEQAATTSSALALRQHRPNVYFGTIASGSLVIADAQKRDELLRLHGKIQGTEMEGAGVMHAAFFHREIPTAAIVIKGVSDPSTKTKDQLDAEGHWRELAKENPVRLLLALLRRGRIRPLRTDRFTLDLTNGSPAAARAFIRDAAAPGVAFLAFERFVLPDGPLTELLIDAHVQGKNGPIQVLSGVTTHESDDGLQQVAWSGRQCVLKRSIKSRAIGVYFMLSSVPVSAIFTVRTPSMALTQEWTPWNPLS